MCTMIVSIPGDDHRSARRVLAHNRDERYDRPTLAPHRWPDADLYGPRDERAGGTWIGHNSAAVVAALTNRFGAEREPSHRSRGAVVTSALSHTSAEDAARAILTWPAHTVAAFHLVVLDARSAWLVWHDGEALHSRALGAGVHVITEHSLGASSNAREARVKADLAARASLDAASLLEALSDATGEGLEAIHVHIPQWGYGTRSSYALTLPDETGSEVVWQGGDVAPAR